MKSPTAFDSRAAAFGFAIWLIVVATGLTLWLFALLAPAGGVPQ